VPPKSVSVWLIIYIVYIRRIISKDFGGELEKRKFVHAKTGPFVSLGVEGVENVLRQLACWRAPDIISGQINMFPTQRRQMFRRASSTGRWRRRAKIARSIVATTKLDFENWLNP
jgi:hypothetical protein